MASNDHVILRKIRSLFQSAKLIALFIMTLGIGDGCSSLYTGSHPKVAGAKKSICRSKTDVYLLVYVKYTHYCEIDDSLSKEVFTQLQNSSCVGKINLVPLEKFVRLMNVSDIESRKFRDGEFACGDSTDLINEVRDKLNLGSSDVLIDIHRQGFAVCLPPVIPMIALGSAATFGIIPAWYPTDYRLISEVSQLKANSEIFDIQNSGNYWASSLFRLFGKPMASEEAFYRSRMFNDALEETLIRVDGYLAGPSSQ